ncbi:hypothetical protein [Streptomyces sp. PU_AKi4]|uniref:hypothetical protein n=1 Tax=Streptomyces sp. PU_AKi4 TaxID=2800809 RepID=UPI003524AAD0
MTTTVRTRADAATINEVERTVQRVIRRAAQRPEATAKQTSWPRPPLVHDHAALFREPVYEGGQPYADDDLEDDGDD